MKIKDLSTEELETKSYAELAEMVLTEKGSAMKIVDVFKKICKALKMSDSEFENNITNFFELISTDKEFIVLDKGFCDLRKKHTPTLIIEDEEDDSEQEIIEDVDDIDTSDEENEDDIFYDTSSDEDDVDDGDDDLNNFIVLDEEDEEASI